MGLQKITEGITGREAADIIYNNDSLVYDVLPKSTDQTQPAPTTLNGYLSTLNNGNFVESANYYSYKFNLASYQVPIYVSGSMRDSGTALAFYYDSGGNLLSYEYRGTASTVVYDKVLLNIPEGTVTIGLTVLSSGGAVQIFTDKLSEGILTEKEGDKRYITQETADNKYIPVSLMPATPIDGDIIYAGVNFDSLTRSGGDTGSTYYANTVSKILKSGTYLKKISVKVSASSSVQIVVINVIDNNGVLTVTKLHEYSPISVNSGTGEYEVDDNYILPLGAILAVKYTGNVGYYKTETVQVPPNSYRINAAFTTVTNSGVILGYNFITSDSEIDLSEIVTVKTGDERYELKSPTIKGLNIILPKQIKVRYDQNNKIILYGDSISSTDYPWYKNAMETLTGATVYNGGFSGQSTANLAKNAQLQRIFDYAPNLIVALVGGNDTGAAGTVGTFGAVASEPLVQETDINADYNGTYFIQAISQIIRKIQSQYYNIRARANLTGNETEAEKTAKIDAVLKPYFVFCTTLAQKRNDANNAFSNPDNWQRKRDAVIECCNKYGVHCIDLFNLVGWDMSLEPYWIGPTDKNTNNGIYTMDGLHPNKYGYEQMAQIVCGELGII